MKKFDIVITFYTILAMSRTACAFSCQKEFLALVDERAKSLGLTRSAYIVQVLRQDILSGRPNLNILAGQMAINGDIVNHGHGRKIVTK